MLTLVKIVWATKETAVTPGPRNKVGTWKWISVGRHGSRKGTAFSTSSQCHSSLIMVYPPTPIRQNRLFWLLSSRSHQEKGRKTKKGRLRECILWKIFEPCFLPAMPIWSTVKWIYRQTIKTRFHLNVWITLHNRMTVRNKFCSHRKSQVTAEPVESLGAKM